VTKTTEAWVRLPLLAALLLLCHCSFAAADEADPPGRVARISYIQNSVSFRPPNETEWFEASTNRPLTTGDGLWVDKDSRGEIHIDSTAIRLSSETGISILDLDDRTVQLRLSVGIIEVHLRHLLYGEAFEIDTPNLALALTGAGEYRIEADPNGRSTSIVVHRGAAEVTGGGESYNLRAGQEYSFTGTDNLTYGLTPTPNADDFEDWCQSREQRENDSPSARFLSRDVDGYYDLDDSGDWQTVQDYGTVWVPRELPSGWVPYHFGHWVSITPWGWTWVGEEKWGFAPFHYGRWAYLNGFWAWVPGPIVVRPVYAPALVAFVGGRGFGPSPAPGSGSSGVAWFPLGPRDVYVPSYRGSLRYVENLNLTNTKSVNNESVASAYDNRRDHEDAGKITYANRQAPDAVTAVSRDTFLKARPVAPAALHITPQQLRSAQVVDSPPVPPTRSSDVSATAKRSIAKPSASILGQPVVATLNPPAPANSPRVVYTNDSPLFNQEHHGRTVSSSSEPSGNEGGAPGSGSSFVSANANPTPNTAHPNSARKPKKAVPESQRPALRFTPPVKAREEMYDVRPRIQEAPASTRPEPSPAARPAPQVEPRSKP
jgi:uncharacterized protein DUF6600